jgi:hypothetical protein
MVVFTILLACAPVLWMVRRHGPNRPRREGKFDGVLLLASLVCSGIALTLVWVSLARASVERRRTSESRPLVTTVEGCWITDQRSGGRDAARSYELRCDVTYPDAAAAGGVRRSTVRAGYPGSRDSYDQWIAAHPPGSTLALRQLQGSGALWGFDHVIDSTTTSAAHAERRALAFAMAAAVLLLCSRAVAARATRS